jgi:hypothetical protein
MKRLKPSLLGRPRKLRIGVIRSSWDRCHLDASDPVGLGSKPISIELGIEQERIGSWIEREGRSSASG